MASVVEEAIDIHVEAATEVLCDLIDSFLP